MREQLALAFDAAPSHWYDAAEWTYCTGLPDRSGASVYTVLIRAPWDPERRPREAVHAEMGNRAAALRWKNWRKVSAEEWCARIVEHLADGEPRTLNRMAVEMVDATADVVGDTAEAGLWLAVERGLVWWTPLAPIHFTLREFIRVEAA